MAEEYQCSVDFLWKTVLSKARVPSKPTEEYEPYEGQEFHCGLDFQYKMMTRKDKSIYGLWKFLFPGKEFPSGPAKPEAQKFKPVYTIQPEPYCTCGRSETEHSGSDVMIGVEV